MKSMLNICLGLWMLLVGCPATYAQRIASEVPGYTGKRVPITLNLHTFPALARATRLADVRLNLRSSFHPRIRPESFHQHLWTSFSAAHPIRL